MSSRSTAHYRRKFRQLNRLLQHSNTSTLDQRTAEEITEYWNQYYLKHYGPEIFEEEERCRQACRQAAQEGNRQAIARRQGLTPLAAALEHAATLASAKAPRQSEATQPQPLPRTRIVRTRYHVRNQTDKLITGLPVPTTGHQASDCLIDRINIDFYVVGLTHIAIKPPILIRL